MVAKNTQITALVHIAANTTTQRQDSTTFKAVIITQIGVGSLMQMILIFSEQMRDY